ncbi:MAG TPA: CBS domain-containing protein, partial [Methylococcaceae bacterium]|nr:CBS domain-containing protein [Methylococcaceae bacterium]
KQVIRTTPISECMTTQFVCCQVNQTVVEIKKNYFESEDENDIYLVDSNQMLLGRVDMKRLLKADDSLTGMDVLQTDVFKFESTDSVELAFNRLKDFVGISVPITQDNKLVGITNEGMLIEFYLESLDDVRNEELGIVKD